MILNQFKALFREAEPITREFIGLMEASFRPYAEIRGTFQQQFPAHLHDGALAALLSGEIKAHLFAPALCESIPDALKALRRSIIRLEDLRQAHPTLPPAVNDLESLARLAERVEALYQRHWELFRYPQHLDEQGLLGLLLEADRVWTDWQAYLLAFHSTRQVQEALSGQPLPARSVMLRVTYTQAPPLHFSVGTLTALTQVLDAAFRFVAAVRQVDAATLPLALQHVEVAEPVELHLLVPQGMEQAYRTCLQYLFLKDMLKREALLKFVFEVVEKAHGAGRKLDAAAMAAFQKDLAQSLKALPETARLTIADRTFPDDAIPVLQEFTATLEANQLDAEPLLRGGDKPKPAGRSRGGAAALEAARRQPEPALSTREAPELASDLGTLGPHGRDYLHILTEKTAE